jgi:CCR4-NOT transcriptional regulation complex NOT5 subunit
MPRDLLQVIAARELTSRNWLYHKEQKIWFMQLPNTELQVKTSSYEKGTYKYFDPNTWKQMTKENFVVEYDKVMQMSENQNVPTSMRGGGNVKGTIGSGAVNALQQQ